MELKRFNAPIAFRCEFEDDGRLMFAEEVVPAFERLRAALVEIKGFNRLRNDLDAYLFEVAKYALGETDEKPSKKDYGLA